MKVGQNGSKYEGTSKGENRAECKRRPKREGKSK